MLRGGSSEFRASFLRSLDIIIRERAEESRKQDRQGYDCHGYMFREDLSCEVDEGEYPL